MSEYQDINLWQNLNGKIKANGEFRLPYGSDDTAPDLGPGSKRWDDVKGEEQTWNGTEWIATGLGEAKIILAYENAAKTTDNITETYLNSTYIDLIPAIGSRVVFTNLTDFPTGVLVAEKYDVGKWFINLTGNKL